LDRLGLDKIALDDAVLARTALDSVELNVTVLDMLRDEELDLDGVEFDGARLGRIGLGEVGLDRVRVIELGMDGLEREGREGPKLIELKLELEIAQVLVDGVRLDDEAELDNEGDDKPVAGFDDGEGERLGDNEGVALGLEAELSAGEETYDMNTEALELALSGVKKLDDRDEGELGLGLRTNEVDGKGRGEVEGRRLALRLVEGGVLGAVLDDRPELAEESVPSPATKLNDGDGSVLEFIDGLGLGDLRLK